MQENPEPTKPGPKPFAPTKRQRGRVMLYVAGGMSEPAIAAAIGICQNTLRKHFENELATGRAKKVAANLDRLEKAADEGNVTAMRHLDAKFGSATYDPDAIRPPKLGKKERDAQAAKEGAVGRYATPSPPRIVTETVQ